MQWRTLDGRIVDIKEMSDQHLNNTVEMLIRKAKKHGMKPAACFGQSFTELTNELTRRHMAKQEDIEALPWSKRIKKHLSKPVTARIRRKFEWE